MQIFHTVHEGKAALYVPTGFWMFEVVDKNVRLHYGVRQSFVQKSEKATAEYRTVLAVMKASGKSVARMTSIASLMAGDDDEEQKMQIDGRLQCSRPSCRSLKSRIGAWAVADSH